LDYIKELRIYIHTTNNVLCQSSCIYVFLQSVNASHPGDIISIYYAFDRISNVSPPYVLKENLVKEKKYIIEVIKKNIWYHTTTITTTNNSKLIIIFLLYIGYDVNYKLISEYKYTVKEERTKKNWVETFKLKEEEKKKSKQSMEWL